jgi:xylan 1,4-beta-xylosidase
VARRVTATRCSLETVVEFHPATVRQLAGITGYYNMANWHHLYLTRTDDGRRELQVLTSESGRRRDYPELSVDASGADRVGLRAVFDGPVLRFGYDLGDGWRDLPVDLDATILSDEHAARIVDGEPAAWGFTGAFVGLWVQDIGADGGYADFDSATYREL